MAEKKPVHPGHTLREEFLEPLDLTARDVAKATGITLPTVKRLSNEYGRVSPEMALRLGRYFGTSSEFWLDLQLSYEAGIQKAELERLKNDPPADLDQITPRHDTSSVL